MARLARWMWRGATRMRATTTCDHEETALRENMRTLGYWLSMMCVVPLMACSSTPDEKDNNKALVETKQKKADPLVADNNAKAGHAALANGDWKSAEQYYARAVKRNPESWELRMNHAITLSRVPDFEGAMAEMQQAANQGGKDSWLFWYNLGNLYQNRGMYEESIKAYRASLGLHQTPNIDILLNLGSGYLFVQRYEEAQQTFDYIIELAPRDPRAHSNLALILQMQKKYPEAVAAYEQVHQLDPEFAQAYFNKADALGGGMNKYAESIAAFERYIQLEPDGPYVVRAKNRIDVMRAKLNKGR
jgi:tetratricopeptide (TPR) repeat protein